MWYIHSRLNHSALNSTFQYFDQWAWQLAGAPPLLGAAALGLALQPGVHFTVLPNSAAANFSSSVFIGMHTHLSSHASVCACWW